MALLLPDPCDKRCPEAFKRLARQSLLNMEGRPSGWREGVVADEGLRRTLLSFIANFANWHNAGKTPYLDTARTLVKAAHPDETPLVVDPFAGGGSIPLEALRLGCEAFASDLNPVACLILKVMLEDIPHYGPGLAKELRQASNDIRRKAQRELADLYPADPDRAMPIAYLWARTVSCEAPNCGAEIPLVRSFWLCRKANRKWALRDRVIRPSGQPPRVELEIFEPNRASDVRTGTVTRAKATCLCCGVVLPPPRVRAQLASQRGGADVAFDDAGNRIGGARMTAVVTLKPDEKRRHYRLPTEADYAAVRKAQVRVAEIVEEWKQAGKVELGTTSLCPVPDEPLPPIGTLGFRVQRYGMLQWGDLFTARQKVAITALAQLIKCQVTGMERGSFLLKMFALALGKLHRHVNVLSKWHRGSESVAGAFAMHTLPMSWDFPEMHPLITSAGGLDNCLVDLADDVATHLSTFAHHGESIAYSETADALDHPLPNDSAHVWFTDPPYYDAIPYADLSDFFLVWHKRVVPGSILQDPLDASNPLSPKRNEAVQDETKVAAEGRTKDGRWFENAMYSSFAQGCRITQDAGIGSVVFAHKTTQGWEALLSGMIRGGWTVTGSWPIATERPARLRARESAALATSVHLICRPRPDDAPIGEWANVLRELPRRVGSWIERLQNEGIRGTDLIFACIGPALEIFSRYSKVETPAGKVVALPEYLERVWEVVGRTALQEVLGTTDAQGATGQVGSLEEDSRLTALFLWTLQGTTARDTDQDDDSAVKFSLPFDVVRRFAQPMGIDLDSWTGRIIGQTKGIVRLVPVEKRAKQLFGDEVGQLDPEWLAGTVGTSTQQSLFPSAVAESSSATRRKRSALLTGDQGLRSSALTTLDRVHAAMLFQRQGETQALRSLIETEQSRGPDFLRLANALSALYPRGSEEKRLVDAMLLAVPG